VFAMPNILLTHHSFVIPRVAVLHDAGVPTFLHNTNAVCEYVGVATALCLALRCTSRDSRTIATDMCLPLLAPLPLLARCDCQGALLAVGRTSFCGGCDGCCDDSTDAHHRVAHPQASDSWRFGADDVLKAKEFVATLNVHGGYVGWSPEDTVLEVHIDLTGVGCDGSAVSVCVRVCLCVCLCALTASSDRARVSVSVLRAGRSPASCRCCPTASS
jgi:hypothetical protein